MIFLSLPALGHRGETARSLRLQAAPGGFEGLLSIAIPPGLEAQALLAPPGLLPGETPKTPRAQLLAGRAALAALRGLHFAAGVDERSLSPIKLELLESKARATQTGGLEGLSLVKLAAPLPAVLRVDAASGPRLRLLLSTPKGYSLLLLDGVGKEAAGGLSLRPRPGKPCLVRIAKLQQTN